MAICQCHNHHQSSPVKNTNNPDGVVIVLGTYVHCDGCRNKILRSLRGYEGVELVEIDAKNHKVTVKGKKADPNKVAERLRKKSGKHVELISPKPTTTVVAVKKEEPKPTPYMIEVVLKVYMHCQGCAKEVKRCIHEMEGVRTVDLDRGRNLVNVKGTMDPKKLVEFVKRRGGKHAEIVKQSITEDNIISRNNECNNNTNSCDHHYPQELEFGPRLFSDENPYSCSVM